jgi:pimeloyl-ACP methyl ester carboxylesterase
VEVFILCTGIPLLVMVFYVFYMKIKLNLMESDVGEPTPDEFNLPYVVLRIPVNSGKLWLNGWFIPATNAKTTIVFGQEFKTSKSAKLKYVQFLHQAGYNVVLFDNRNYHHKKKEKAWFFIISKLTEDFAAVLRYINTIPEIGNNNIVVYAFSISTLIVLNLLAKFKFNIKAVIFDSGPSNSLSNMTEGYLEQFRTYIIPSYLNGPIIYWMIKKSYGIMGKITLYPQKWPPKFDLNHIEFLFIANEEDIIVPAVRVKRMADKYPQAEYWMASATRHLMAFRDHKGIYKKLVLQFLNKLEIVNIEDSNSKIV